MTTNPPAKRPPPLGGMDYTTRPHMLSPEQWRLLYNVRVNGSRLEQVPLKKVAYYAVPYSRETLLAVVNLPVGYHNSGLLVGLTQTQVLALSPSVSTPLKTADGSALVLQADEVYRRWGTCVHNGYLFFVNELNEVKYTDGVIVRHCGQSSNTYGGVISYDAPRGRFVEVFYDHLVIGAPTFRGAHRPWHVMWSHLHNYDIWSPAQENEADSYACTEFQSEDCCYAGVTGLKRYKNLMLVFTPNCIYAMQYIGLPRVVHMAPLVNDFGNGLPYGTAGLDNAVVFVDLHHRNFFAYRGGPPEAFGSPVQDYIFNDADMTPEVLARTWAYVDKQNTEVVWVYHSGGSEVFDKAVAFNYSNKTWSVRTVEGVHSFTVAGRAAVRMKELTGVMTGYTGNWNALTEGAVIGRVWGGANTAVMKEEVSGDSSSVLLHAPAPILETGDLDYGEVGVVKEVPQMVINATASKPTMSFLVVKGAARRLYDAVLTWKELGHWRDCLSQEMLTFPALSGKVLRYRFEPSPSEESTTEMIYRSETPIFELNASLAALGTSEETVSVMSTSTDTYYVEFIIRGAFEMQTYVDPDDLDGTVATGGTPTTDTAMIVKLTTSSPAKTYYLNNGYPTSYSVPVEFRLRVPVTGTSTIALSMSKTDGTMYTSDAGGGTPEGTESAEEWCTAELNQTLTENVTEERNGNIRGFLFASFEEAVGNRGATR